MKIFIVDDEEIIRSGIRNFLEQTQGRFVFAGEAPDGEMAYPIIQEVQPDVLITDVRMPFMDGLELTALIRKNMPWMQIIILSGHDEFEYAQAAIKLGVSAYLLKPIDSKMLLAALTSMEEKIQKELEYYKTAHENQAFFEEQTHRLYDAFCTKLMHGGVGVADALEESATYNIDLVAPCYLVGQTSVRAFGLDERKRIRILVQTLYQGRSDIVLFITGGGRLVYLLKGDDAEGLLEGGFEVAQALRHELMRHFQADLYFGIGSVVQRLGEVSRAYEESKLVQRLDTVSKIARFEDGGKKETSMDFSEEGSLKERLRYAQEEDVPALVAKYFASADDNSVQSALYRYYLLMDLVVTVCRIAESMGIDQLSVVPEAGNPQKILGLTDTVERSIDYAKTILLRLIAQRQGKSLSRYEDMIRSAREYISAHYMDPDLSLRVVAKEVSFSPSHFSAVFSQESGDTFVGYLTKKRIEVAKGLLLDTDMKLSDIAQAIGYGEAHYFSYNFKKYVGVSPREFRNNG